MKVSPSDIDPKLKKGQLISFYSETLKKSVTGRILRHWQGTNKWKVEVYEDGLPRAVLVHRNLIFKAEGK